MTTHREQNAAIRDQFGKQAESYGRLIQTTADPGIALLMKAARPSAKDRVLDVGCGTGRLAVELAAVTGHVTGLDLTEAMLDQAKALQAERGVSNITWKLGDALPLPFADGAFSLIVTRATFHHFHDPAAVFAEMMRVCTQQGRIVVVDQAPEPAKAHAFNTLEKLRDPSHVRALTASELRALGRRPGLTETAFDSFSWEMPLEAILATSFPEPGDMDRIRAMVRDDAMAETDRYSLGARMDGDTVMIAYPRALVCWTKD